MLIFYKHLKLIFYQNNENFQNYIVVKNVQYIQF